MMLVYNRMNQVQLLPGEAGWMPLVQAILSRAIHYLRRAIKRLQIGGFTLTTPRQVHYLRKLVAGGTASRTLVGTALFLV